MDIDDLEPRKAPKKPKDLSGYSIEELNTYIETLQAEIERARATIAAKQAHRASVDVFFKK